MLEARGQQPNVVRMQGLELSLQSAEVKHQNHIERTCAATEDVLAYDWRVQHQIPPSSSGPSSVLVEVRAGDLWL